MVKTITKTVLISTLFALSSLLAACGGSGSQAASGSSASRSTATSHSRQPVSSPSNHTAAASSTSSSGSGTLTPIQIVLSHYPSLLEYAPYYVAMDKGWFKQAGIKLEINSGGGGGDTMRTLSTGGIDIAQGGAPAALLEAMRDKHVELVGGFEDINEFTWIVPPNSKVHSVKDLAGAKLAFTHAGSATEWTIHEVVRLAHIPNVTYVSCGAPGSCWVAAKSGSITAGIGVEPFVAVKERTDHARVVLTAAKYIKHYVLDLFDVNTKWANAHKSTLKQFFQVLQRGIDYVQSNPNVASQITAKYLKMPEWAVKQGLQYYYSISKQPWALMPPKAAVATLQQGMIANGQLKKPVDFFKILNPEFLPKQATQ